MTTDPLERLRIKAAGIPVYVGPFMSPEIREHVASAAQLIIASGSEEDLRHYLEYGTDGEVVCLLSELSLQAPLDSEAFRIYMHLFRKLFLAMGRGIPDGIAGPEADAPLDSFHQHILNDLKREVRRTQTRKAARS